MRVLKFALAATFLAASMVVVTGTAEAAKKKDKPGKCGVMKYYDKKAKSCKSKG
jgi:hypothetical protein